MGLQHTMEETITVVREESLDTMEDTTTVAREQSLDTTGRHKSAIAHQVANITAAITAMKFVTARTVAREERVGTTTTTEQVTTKARVTKFVKSFATGVTEISIQKLMRLIQLL